MSSPAYDLRSDARPAGNPDRLPRSGRLPMLLVSAVLVGSLAVFASARVLGALLERRLATFTAEQQRLAERVTSLDRQLSVPRWRNETLATQPLVVRLLASTPRDLTLSELAFGVDPTPGRYRFRAGINSDRNTAARRFREMLGHLQREEGLQVVSIQQVAASGAVVFEATLAPGAGSASAEAVP